MKLDEFISDALFNIIKAIDKTNEKSNREVLIGRTQNGSTSVEFDIAVSAETASKGDAGIKVMAFLDIGGGREYKNSSISRINFAVHIDPETKEQVKKRRDEIKVASRNCG